MSLAGIPEAHPLENQKLASNPNSAVDPDLKPEDRPTTSVLIELVPGENGVYKVANAGASGGVQLSDTELALVEQFRKSQEDAAAKAAADSEAEAAKTTVPAASISPEEQQELDDWKAFQAFKANASAPVEQTGASVPAAGEEEYKVPGGDA